MNVLIALGLALCTRAGFAQTAASNYIIHQDFVTPRALAMGNAFTAVTDDYSAIFYDPALLPWRKSSELRFFVRADTSPASLKLFNEASKADKSSDPETAYTDLITSRYGQNFGYRMPTIGAAYVRPNWGIGFVPADLSLDASIHRNVGPTLNVTSYLDSTLAFSYGTKLNWFSGHQTSWGATAKAIHRFYINEQLLAADLAQNGSVWDTSLAQEGLTFDVDLAFAWRPPVPDGWLGFLKYARPSFSLVGRNLIDYGFKTNFHLLSKSDSTPPELYRRLDVGTKWELPRFWVFDPHFAADVRDIGHPNFTFRKGIHVGVEAFWRMRRWWKGYWSVGMNQMYLTAGVGAKLGWFQLDVATYGEEVGTINNPEQSRRYVAEMALDF